MSDFSCFNCSSEIDDDFVSDENIGIFKCDNCGYDLILESVISDDNNCFFVVPYLIKINDDQ